MYVKAPPILQCYHLTLKRHLIVLNGPILHDQEHQTTLFVDDAILFLTDLGKSIPPHLGLISQFGAFSGFKVNQAQTIYYVFK